MGAMQRMNLSYKAVRILPFLDKIINVDYIGEPEDAPDIEVAPYQYILVLGSTSLVRIAKSKG